LKTCKVTAAAAAAAAAITQSKALTEAAKWSIALAIADDVVATTHNRTSLSADSQPFLTCA
jgi:3-hydroxy-3-methylglutaryl CoA synthase